ncbi:MAG: hypothetical protein ACTS73_05120 [Arsenophonus sp. NEOnobi-MAG3]
MTCCIAHLLEQYETQAYNTQSRFANWSLTDLAIISEKWQLKPLAAVMKPLAAVIKRLNTIKSYLLADEIVHTRDPDHKRQFLLNKVLDFLALLDDKKQRCSALLN